jgi:hypothetical protein
MLIAYKMFKAFWGKISFKQKPRTVDRCVLLVHNEKMIFDINNHWIGEYGNDCDIIGCP